MSDSHSMSASNLQSLQSMAAGIDVSAPPKKKNKPESQKRRDKKKTEKRRKIQKAKRAAAPKNKDWKPDPVLEALKQSITFRNIDSVQGPKEDQTFEGDDTGTESGGQTAVEVLGDKEKKQKEKKEKREKRQRKEERRAEREAAITKMGVDVSSGEGTIIVEEIPEPDQAEEREKNKSTPSLERSPSPPPLVAFPLPRSAPAPDASVLARQGLPKGLEDATFIDQSLRVDIEELRVEGQDEALSVNMRRRLNEIGVEDFFAVQAAMLPRLLPLQLIPSPYSPLPDYLISAPTGSGKTLAYTIPIIEILSQRTVCRLRALIILPTRDLVFQVRETMEALSKGTGLTIGTVTGQHSFAQERKQLVADLDTPLLGGSSKLDILIATPGRLMDHLASTPNFTLQHLRFLVIDEADRLLNQSFQDWLTQVLAYTRPPVEPIAPSFKRKPYDTVSSAFMEACGLVNKSEEWCDSSPSICQKLLFSATLTRDPSKVAALSLHHPQYYIVQSSSAPALPTSVGEQFALPSSLSEKMLILPPALKPLNLIHLIHHPEFNVDRALVFTKSVESAARLVKLLEFFEDAYVLGGGGGKRLVIEQYSGEMRARDKKQLLAEFGEGKINLIVCSDLIARGIDLPSVSHVVSYDIPLDIRKYVHRVGRTARAGRQGTAWTLVEKQEALHFKGMLQNAGHLKAVKKVKVKEDDLSRYRESYEIAIKRLKDYYHHD
ncbi:ATP-dependent RNA helicase DDX51/DBP6 [Cryptococcus neoformans C23]|uniref:ATP-dependent RNA helicase n=1 Tax=Cryptococcus neoformans (strain H99 / ATCC 208821 / CBS 10515 / FGSC 9487) TaxID=235443 RepID=J9VUA7_CRYN9|nr:ATP-dependent RNA helicase DDX51/DBP6 [Cryptococcus neoformans var. grubii H99]AUB28127.1 ATP-dependent RNA helicase DDX51/DBP6 [Cryptococcus neoformans var. grubii]OWZ34576.1 ATP-dependent RNA helicase DDX51/DBP6 [Cryptococcus neoformans var. grubii AD2-60a]OWZ46660.1 ATP-dependent RNA helicase DDX51/DBP6 [Cryptococcus neoformans var. grubii C23]OXC81861.1 ATP-dependent RNA helicase DDX51/DBP6 [Cryptococcus neoformans var. grubii AD1-7a]AFR98027.1 ATP-dependent RNA helicase DDX51/DBP6 [Cry|eukprot:XP_012052932.1 ATP-dependent RNA helicase DDX51/DBP6 [Cryptococcus neoformans var. grubii H99]